MAQPYGAIIFGMSLVDQDRVLRGDLVHLRWEILGFEVPGGF